jgi:hypothetical protein
MRPESQADTDLSGRLTDNLTHFLGSASHGADLYVPFTMLFHPPYDFPAEAEADDFS